MKIKFNELGALSSQLQAFNHSTTCSIEIARNKIRTKRIFDPELEQFYLERSAVIELYGIKEPAEDGTERYKTKPGFDAQGKPIQVYDFGAKDAEANEKLKALHKEWDEKEYDVDLIIPNKENIDKTLKLKDIPWHQYEFIVEYLFS